MNKGAVDTLVSETIASLSNMGCSSVRVFVTFPDGEENSGSYSLGAGDFYAQLGCIREWVTIQDERARMHARSSSSGRS